MLMRHTLALLLLLSSPAISADQTPLTYDRITLTAEAGEAVENDTLKAVMFAQSEGKDTAQLTREINRAVSSAVEVAKRTEGIKVQTLDYTTTPVYHKQSVSGWRIRQSISLESGDSTLLSRLIGTLQKHLEVGNISYTLSPEGRQKVENRLITDALGHFSQRARLISQELGHPGYRLVDINVASGGGQAPRPYAMRTMMLERSDSAPPALEAGTQRVEVSVSGTIELLPD